MTGPLLARVGALLVLATGLGPACYSPPQPRCGFRCGAGNACPPSYTCSTDDGVCHLDNTPLAESCSPDAGVVDAPPILPDTPEGSDGPFLDGPIDGPNDGPIDGPIDGPTDGPPDAPPDVPQDAAPDAALDAPI